MPSKRPTAKSISCSVITAVRWHQRKAGSLILEDTPTALKFRVPRLPRTSYTADFLGMLRAKSIVPGVLPLFTPTPLSVARRLFSNGKAVEEEPEEGNPGVFRRVVKVRLAHRIEHPVQTAKRQPRCGDDLA